MLRFNFDTLDGIVIGGSACENIDGIATALSNDKSKKQKLKKLLGSGDISNDFVKNSCIAVIGPFEINCKNMEAMRHELERLNTLLSDNSSRMVLINAENDDPELIIDVCDGLTNIHPCIGNGIIRTKSSLLLAIGGGVPIGAKWRSEHGYNTFEFLPAVNIEKLSHESLSNELMVLSSYPPTFFSEIPPLNSDWVRQDPSVRRKYLEATFEMDKLFHYIVTAGLQGVKWFSNCSSERIEINNVTIIDKSSFEIYRQPEPSMKVSFTSAKWADVGTEGGYQLFRDYNAVHLEVDDYADTQIQAR